MDRQAVKRRRAEEGAGGDPGAGPIHAAGGGWRAAGAQGEPPKAFPLLSLPEGLIGAYVWPRLGPIARTQLRATCKQLRAVADEQLLADSHFASKSIRVVLTAEELSPHAHSSSHCTGAGAALHSLCSYLRKLPCITELSLVINTAVGSERRAKEDADPAILGSALARLGQATGASLLRLDVKTVSMGSHSRSLCVTPAVLEAVGSHFPRLTHFRLGPCTAGEGAQARWAAALSRLPRSLVHLHVNIHAHWVPCDEADARAMLTQVQRQAVWQPALRSLHIEWKDFLGDLKPLGSALATAQKAAQEAASEAGGPVPGAVSAAPLWHLAVHGRVEEQFGQPLASVLASPLSRSNLRRLELGETFMPARDIMLLLRQLPLIQHFTLIDCTDDGSCAQVLQSLSSLQHLTSLTVPINAVSGVQGHGEESEEEELGQDPNFMLPATLTRLEFARSSSPCDYWMPGRLASFLSQHVPSHCSVAVGVLDSLDQKDAAAALAHPGGVGMVLTTLDPVTLDGTRLEVPGMVCMESPEVLQALASTHSLQALLLPISREDQGRTVAWTLLNHAANSLHHLHTLGLAGGQLGPPEVVLDVLSKVLEEGQLPQLRTLLLVQDDQPYCTSTHRLGPRLAWLQRAGCRLHLLPSPDPGRLGSLAELQQMRRDLPDPDSVLLGVRREAHADGA